MTKQDRWIKASSEVNDLLNDMVAGRDDLIATIGPKVTKGDYVAYTDPDNGDILVDTNKVPGNNKYGALGLIEPEKWSETPVLRGLITHEAAHASHTNHVIPKRTPDALRDAAMMLEESRVEKRMLERRPQDAPYLKASAEWEVGKAEYHLKYEKPTFKPNEAMHAAAIILARADAGIIDNDERVQKIREAVESSTSKETVKDLEKAWKMAQTAGDNDWATMEKAAQIWVRAARDAGAKSQAPHPQQETEQGKAGKGGNPVQGKSAGSKNQRNVPVNLQKLPPPPAAMQTSEARDEQERVKAVSIAQNILGEYRKQYSDFREPYDDERIRARKTKKRIQSAYFVDKTKTRVASEVPPGRLQVRDLIQADAETAAGLVATPEPFRRKEIKRDIAPPLHVAIIQDVSGSQTDAAQDAASGAWSLATAVRGIPESRVLMLAAGDDTYNIFSPFEDIPGVPRVPCDDGHTAMTSSMLAAEGKLDLMHDNAARLMVLITDGEYSWGNRDRDLRRYVDAGVKVLYINTQDEIPFAGRTEPQYVEAYNEYKRQYEGYKPRPASGVVMVDAVPGRDNIAQIICDAAVQILDKD